MHFPRDGGQKGSCGNSPSGQWLGPSRFIFFWVLIQSPCLSCVYVIHQATFYSVLIMYVYSRHLVWLFDVGPSRGWDGYADGTGRSVDEWKVFDFWVFYMTSPQNAGNAISESLDIKISGGRMSPDPQEISRAYIWRPAPPGFENKTTGKREHFFSVNTTNQHMHIIVFLWKTYGSFWKRISV